MVLWPKTRLWALSAPMAEVRPFCARRSPLVRSGRLCACVGFLALPIPLHVRDENNVGPNRHRLCDRACHDLGCDAVGRLEAWFSSPAWESLVRNRLRYAGLFAAGLLLVVVCLRCVRARGFSSKADASPPQAVSSRSSSPSECLPGEPARRTPQPHMDRRGGQHQLEIKSAKLLDADGVVLGRFDRHYLRHDGPEHVLCFAPTRSGKGVGLVVPTLLTWPGSCIVHDIKGENWTLTSGFRARHGRVLLFDPTNPNSAAYNPLLEVRRGEWEVRDVQNIADVLVDPEGALERRNHWEKTSHSLLVGAILHVLYAEPDKTLAGVANFLSDPRRPIEVTLRAMMTTSHLGEAGPHPVIASAARELLNKSENERSGVLSTAMSFLGLYRDPVVAQVTRRCDWRIRDLVEANRRYRSISSCRPRTSAGRSHWFG